MRVVHWRGDWIIHASRKQVYALMTDFENWPSLMPGIVKSTRVVERTDTTAIVHGVFTLLGQKGEGLMNIQLDPPHGYYAENVSRQLGKEWETLQFQEVDQGTLFIWSVKVEPKKFIVRLMAPFLSLPIRWFYKRTIILPVRRALEK
ncbi:MAG: SRPBCC family protein [Pyrinomonadaceae bacterium]